MLLLVFGEYSVLWMLLRKKRIGKSETFSSCFSGHHGDICDKSNITATSENILLVYCVSDCLACTGLKTDASSLCLRGQRTVLLSFSRSLKGDLFSQL